MSGAFRQARKPLSVGWLLIVKLITARRQVLEARVLTEERQPGGTDWTITLFADDDFGQASVFALRVVIVILGSELTNKEAASRNGALLLKK